MTPIATACRPHTADARRVRWRFLGMIAVNIALWGAVFTLIWSRIG